MKVYQKNCPIKRPVLGIPPWWQVDLQALPPHHWCPGCGGEVYSGVQILCPRCRKTDNWQWRIDSFP